MSILKRKGKGTSKPKPEEMNIARLTKVQLVMILSAAGARITEADVATDLAEGAPFNPDRDPFKPDGTINLLNYAAWLASLAD